MPTDDFLAASLPLFEVGMVDVVEWSFDTAWSDDDLPPWMPALLDDFAASSALLAHGVGYSTLSARWEPRQEAWLARLREAFARRRYQRVSEHFGFMTADGFAYGAPLPVPFTEGALRVGRDRLERLADAARVPIGLENLALAFGPGLPGGAPRGPRGGSRGRATSGTLRARGPHTQGVRFLRVRRGPPHAGARYSSQREVGPAMVKASTLARMRLAALAAATIAAATAGCGKRPSSTSTPPPTERITNSPHRLYPTPLEGRDAGTPIRRPSDCEACGMG